MAETRETPAAAVIGHRMRWLALSGAVAASVIVFFVRPWRAGETPAPNTRIAARIKPIDFAPHRERWVAEPDSPSAKALEAYERSDYVSARDQLATLPASPAEGAELSLLRGSAELLSGRPAGALAHLTRAAATAWSLEQEIEARWQLANARLALGQKNTALADLRILASIPSPHLPEARELSELLIADGAILSASSLGPIPARLYVSSSWMIRRVKGTGVGSTPLVNNGSPRQVALDASGGQLYWVDQVPARVVRARIDGSERKILVDDNLVSPHGIVLYPTLGRMFWTDGHRGLIESAFVDGSGRETVLLGLDGPRYLALDPANGKLYWAEYGDGVIARANVDGSDVEILVAGRDAFGIALDLSAAKMYWTEYGGSRIARSNLDGSEVEVLVQMTADVHPTGIAIDGDTLYWTAAPGGTLRRSDLDGRGAETILELGEPGYDVVVDHTALPVAASPAGVPEE